MSLEYLIKTDQVIFKDIISGGYIVKEYTPIVLEEKRMVDGSILRNYGVVTDTEIQIKFGKLKGEVLYKYMKVFKKAEETFTYYSPIDKTYKTNKFFIELEDITMDASYGGQTYAEFTVKLRKSGG